MNCILTKVAIIRDKHGSIYLNCKCGAKPETNIETKKDVTCECGKTFSYNGWVK